MHSRKHLLVFILLFLCTFSMLIPAVRPTVAVADTVVLEEGFEGDTSAWYTYSYNGGSEFAIDGVNARSGNNSFYIRSEEKNDARAVYKLKVTPSTAYTVTAYAMVSNVKSSDWSQTRVGATISIMETLHVSESIEGDSSWERIDFAFITGDHQYNVELCFTLGGYSAENTGEVWFDDITVKQVDVAPKDAFQLENVPQFVEGNILSNGGFEDDMSFWDTYSYYDGASEFIVDNTVSHGGNCSLLIQSNEKNDARIVQEIPVQPNNYYTVVAWIKTEGVPESTHESPCYGATISVIDTTFVSNSIEGSRTWSRVRFSFYTADGQDSVKLCFTLGGYSMINSGKAWFDDITVEQVKDRPGRVFNLTYSNDADFPTTDHWAGYSRTEHADSIKWMFFAFLWYMVLAILALVYAEAGDIKAGDNKLKKAFAFILAGGFLFRVVIALFTVGFSYDINMFKYWSGYAATDLFNMYSGWVGFIDYPPLYMYILAPLGIPIKLLEGFMGGAVSNLLIRIPSIIADIVSSWILYRVASKYLDKKWAFFIGVFYVMNPATWINSAGWAQVDSLFTMLILIELICVLDKKWAGAGIAFALMVLMKPHGIIFTPAIGLVLLFEIIKNKNFKPMLIAVGAGVGVGIIVVLPFYIRMGFENPLWLPNLYMGTIGQYNYASLNGFNFWAMIGKNLSVATGEIWGFTYSQWGTAGIMLAIVLAIVFMILATRKKSVVAPAAMSIVSLVLIVTVFTFAHKMHERYMFPAIAIALFIFMITKARGFMYLAILYSALIFINTYYIYNLNVMYIYCHPMTTDKLVMLLGGIEVLSFLLMIVLTIKVAVKGWISKPASLRTNNESIEEVNHE